MICGECAEVALVVERDHVRTNQHEATLRLHEHRLDTTNERLREGALAFETVRAKLEELRVNNSSAKYALIASIVAAVASVAAAVLVTLAR